MKKRNRTSFICITAILLTIVFSAANAAGLFPEMDELFGLSMPSVGLAIGREADEQSETETGSKEVYHHFESNDYLAFGQYLAGIGAKVKDYKTENSTLTVTISVRGAIFVFTYDWVEHTGTAIYSEGTRAEKQIEGTKPGESILPSIEGVMPSVEFAINRKPDEEMNSAEGLVQKWNSFSDEDYLAFSAYLAETGAQLKDSRLDAGILNAEISLNGLSYQFVFDWNAQTASVIYPEGTKPESSRWNAPVSSGFVLPDVNSLGRELPRISAVLEREPSSTETLEDGGVQETYLDFSEEDYNTFSQYLQQKDCTLKDYHTDDSVLTINLSNGSGEMTFIYDALQHIGITQYPYQNRIEKAWTTPEPENKPKPTSDAKPAPKATERKYNETECWRIAKKYFENLPWKDPSSLQIHSYNTELTATNGSFGYLFTIDYSARNGFGGMNRGLYWITVDVNTGKIVSAFGND